jgi:hypothetical protein
MTTAFLLILAVALAVWFSGRFARLLSGDGYGHTSPPRHVH